MLNVCTMIGTSSLLFGTSTLAKFYIVNTEGVSIAPWHLPPYEKGERRAKCQRAPKFFSHYISYRHRHVEVWVHNLEKEIFTLAY